MMLDKAKTRPTRKLVSNIRGAFILESLTYKMECFLSIAA
jgi:hypothetical protein